MLSVGWLLDLTEADLQAFVDNHVSEQKSLEYKQTLPGSSDGDKREFLEDVSSFANATGGLLIFGVREEAGEPVEVCGLDVADYDAEILRLSGSIRDGIAPRIANIHMYSLRLTQTGKVAIVLRIPKSYAAPHMVTYKGSSRFVSRHSNGKYRLDVGEIRAAFVLGEAGGDRCREFRFDRLSRILASETPIPLEPVGKVVLHIVPLTGPGDAARLDLTSISNVISKVGPAAASLYRTGYSDSGTNFDGLFTYTWSDRSKPYGNSYWQMFRFGAVETVSPPNFNGVAAIPSISFEQGLLHSLEGYLEILRMLGVEPPLFVMLSLLGVKGYRMGISGGFDDGRPIDRDNLLCPEVIVEHFGCDIGRTMKPAIDSVWNATGWAGFPHYIDGKWKRPR